MLVPLFTVLQKYLKYKKRTVDNKKIIKVIVNVVKYLNIIK